MTDDVKDDRETTPPSEGAKAEAKADERRREGRRVTERKSGAVRQAIRKQLEEDAPDTAERAAIKREKGEAKPIIQLENVYLGFGTPILENVSLTANKGETICIVGESGTGKSTTLKLILRLLIPDKGCVNIDGEEITHLTFVEALEVRQRMGMVFQGAALFD